jgi:broad specificity phosphatase PhoE
VGNALESIVLRHPDETIGIVAHGGVIKSIGFHIGHLQKGTVATTIIHNAKPLHLEYLHGEKRYNVIDFPVAERK